MIWCIEDDASIREIEIYTLRATGFEAEGFESGAELKNAIKKGKPDLIILDVMLPGEDGVQLLKNLKNNNDTCNIPVIMATAKGMEFDIVQSLDLGADDYLVKPFGMMEMVSRVKAVLRRCEKNSPQHMLKFADIVINTDEHTVTVEGKRVTLTLKEYEILKLFMSHPGVAFTRDQLFSEIWGDNYVGETRTVDMHIKTLRQKLGQYGQAVETVRGVGYRLEVKQ